MNRVGLTPLRNEYVKKSAGVHTGLESIARSYARSDKRRAHLIPITNRGRAERITSANVHVNMRETRGYKTVYRGVGTSANGYVQSRGTTT